MSGLGHEQSIRLLRYDAAKKSTGIAYILWFFLGLLGVHRFYLGSTGIGILVLICSFLGLLTFGITTLVSFLVLFIDMFTIPGKVQRYNEALIGRLSA